MADLSKDTAISCIVQVCQCVPSSLFSCLVKQKQRDHYSENKEEGTHWHILKLGESDCALLLHKSALQHFVKQAVVACIQKEENRDKLKEPSELVEVWRHYTSELAEPLCHQSSNRYERQHLCGYSILPIPS